MASLVLGGEPVNSHVVSPWVPELFALLGEPLSMVLKAACLLTALETSTRHGRVSKGLI